MKKEGKQEKQNQRKQINWSKLYLSDYYQKVGNAFICNLCKFRTGSRKEIRKHMMDVHKSQIRAK